ncbi:MAG: hypothetical protein SGI87_05550 [Flavobacteriales bacterium]|nr:hypothetical protein [Flavobacteriales bacterium]
MSSRANRRTRRVSGSHEPIVRKLIDRDLEKKQFEEFLEFKDDRRVLAILDDKGMGKSLLLETLAFQCRSQKLPVCLFALDQLADIGPHSVIQNVAQQLKRQGIPIPRFERVENARMFGDPSSIYKYSNVDGRVTLDGADFTGSKDITVTGTYIEHQEIRISSTQLTENQETKAKESSIQSFFEDLREYCIDKPVIILLDAYEKCCPLPEEEDEFVENWAVLEDWIIEEFLRHLFFDLQQRPSKLILVLAGRRGPDFMDEFPVEHQKVVSVIDALSLWERHHVEECLQMMELDYHSQDVDSFFHFLKRGAPILNIINMMNTLKNRHERKNSRRN